MKTFIEKLCQFYGNLGKTKYTVIRHSNIYGPHDKYDLERSHVFGATVTKVMTAKEGERIIVWGTGEEERDLLHVSDLVEAVELIINKQEAQFELYNVGYGSFISIKELVSKVITSSGKNIGIEYDFSKPTIKTRLCLDITKVKESMGWIPKMSLDEGIKKFFENVGISKNDLSAADLKAREEVSKVMLLWIINGSPQNPIKPPALTFSLRASGSCHVSTRPAHFTTDSVVSVQEGGEVTPNKGQTRAKRDTLTLGFNTPYAARWELNDFQPGEVSLANGPVGAGWLRSHIQSDSTAGLRLYAMILKRESGG